MDRSTKVCQIIEDLHEELDASVVTLDSLQVGVVMRAAAAAVLDEVAEERVALLAYLNYHHPDDARLQHLINACQQGAHRKRASLAAMEAVVVLERRG